MKKVVLSLFFMAFMQALIGQTHWVPVSGIQNNMTMSAVLYINGEEQFLDSIEIGAFCGEECRAAALPYEIVGERVYFLTIKGTSNEVITFRLYDHQMDTELDYVCDTTYTFVIDDIVGDYPDWFPIHFSAPVPSFVEQTIALAAGWNWFSTYVEITMNDLKDALRTALPTSNNITIKSKSNGQTRWNGSTWIGQLRQLDLSQMYKIQVNTACEITLQGMPINPAEHPATIKPGNNWIAFPLGEGMSVANAFADTDTWAPTNGDIVKSQGSGQARRLASVWTGTLKNLVPGQGYYYNSTATSNKTLIYPTSAK